MFIPSAIGRGLHFTGLEDELPRVAKKLGVSPCVLACSHLIVDGRFPPLDWQGLALLKDYDGDEVIIMQWEYKDVLVYEPREAWVSSDQGKNPIEVPGEKGKHGPRLRDYLRYLGNEGWEVTGVLTNRGEHLILLKRLLDE